MPWREGMRVVAQGLALGFSIAAPVGPIGVLCIRRAMTHGFRSGLASGLGAASADAVYGAVAAAGLTLVADFLVSQQVWLGMVGGGFLLLLGIRTFLAPSTSLETETVGKTVSGDYFSTFLLTLSNPMTILSFAAIFGGLSAQTLPVYRLSAFLLVAGVFAGSALWWLMLSAAAGFLRSRVTPGVLVWINRLSGAVISSFGLMLLWNSVLGA